MNIIIVGCGKVGHTLVEQLGGEQHDIVVVDLQHKVGQLVMVIRMIQMHSYFL